MSSTLALTLVARLVLAPALGPEQTVDEPVWWPAGEFQDQVRTPYGVVLAFSTDQVRVGLLRAVDSDGGVGPLVTREAALPIRLVHTSAGVLGVSGGSGLRAQVFDARSAQLLGPSREVRAVGPNMRAHFVTGGPGDVLLVVTDALPDAGLRTSAGPLSDDGTLLDGGLRETLPLGQVVGLTTAHGRHWGLFQGVAPDAGRLLTVASFTSDGTASSVAALPLTNALPQARLVATASHLVVLWNDTGGLTDAFLTPQGVVAAQGAVAGGCLSFASAPLGDEVLTACARGVGLSSPTTVVVVRSMPDGGHSTNTLFDGDGGALSVRALEVEPTPQLTFSRDSLELGRGTWSGLHLLPLAPDGLSAVGPTVTPFLRASRQRAPSFASVGPGGPHALVWYDDRQLPLEDLPHCARQASTGELLEPPFGMPKARAPAFTQVNLSGRGVASDGRDFVVIDSDGFDVSTAWWSSDAGPPAPRAALTNEPGNQYYPAIWGSPGGYLAAWRDTRVVEPNLVGQRLDSRAVPLDAAPLHLAANLAAFDGLWDGSRYLLLTATQGQVRFVALGPSGPPSDVGVLAEHDGGVIAARLARSGDVLLAAWEVALSANTSEVRALRFPLDGGAALDAAPHRLSWATLRYGRSLWDIGVRDGVFHLLGVEAGDGGTRLWVWRLGADGRAVDDGPVVFDEPQGLTEVAAGPALADGGLLLAYARAHPELSPETTRLHYRVLTEACAADGRPIIYQVGCECGSASGGWPLLLALAVGLRAHHHPQRRRVPQRHLAG